MQPWSSEGLVAGGGPWQWLGRDQAICGSAATQLYLELMGAGGCHQGLLFVCSRLGI